MTTTDYPTVADSIEQAADKLQSALAQIFTDTDHINESVVDRIDLQKTLTNLHKIAIMCRRLEFQLTAYKTYKDL